MIHKADERIIKRATKRGETSPLRVIYFNNDCRGIFYFTAFLYLMYLFHVKSRENVAAPTRVY